MSKTKKKALGSGIDSLIPTNPEPIEDEKEETAAESAEAAKSVTVTEVLGKPLQVKVSEITRNPDQPRKNFDVDELNKLVNSIKDQGILEPLVAFKTETGYQLIAGHRRLLAAQMANFETVPLFIRERKGDDTENLELSLIENIIRQDLNPIEEAEALYRLEKEYKQDVLSIAKLVGKDSSSVKNCIRLLKLPEPVKQDIREGRLSSGHGKVLLSLEDQPEDLMQCRAVILSKSLTVRQTEVLTKKVNNKYGKRPISRMKEERTIYFETLERLVSEALNGLKVEIIHEGRKKKIIINYNTLESIEAFLQKLDITIPS